MGTKNQYSPYDWLVLLLKNHTHQPPKPELPKSLPKPTTSNISMASLFLSPAPPPRLSSCVKRVHSFGGTSKLNSLTWDFNFPNKRVSFSPKFSVERISVTDEGLGSDYVDHLKFKLLSAVSGLNRGLAASEDDLRNADDAAKELEAAAGPVDLSSNLDKLQGRWRLIYSSAFSSRTLGGSRPGPPTGRLLPITLGQVFQRIDVVSKDFDNIVELELGAPWPLPPAEVTATLAHKFELIGTSKVKIVFEKTTVKTRGNLSQLPPLEVPQIPDALRPSSSRGSGDFEVTYVDSNTRVTRGDRGELRVFVIA